MLGRLILLFTAVPLLELALLAWIGTRVGIIPTIVLVLTTGALGATLARHQGLATWQRFHQALNRGRLPKQELVEGLLILVAGALLITPGILTDLTGFLILVPPLRRRLATTIGEAVRRRTIGSSAPQSWRASRAEPARSGRSPSPSPADPDDGVIDAEFEVLDRNGSPR